MTGIEGMDKLLRNLNKEIIQIKQRSMKGTIKAATLIRYDMDKTPPLIPVDTGNLRQSWFVSPFYAENKQPAIKMGFSANYAVYVHEMLQSKLGKKINWTRPDSGPKFFEAAIKRNVDEVLRIIKENVQIKK